MVNSKLKNVNVSIDELVENIEIYENVALYGFGEFGQLIHCLFERSNALNKIKVVVDRSAENGEYITDSVLVQSPEVLAAFKGATVIVASMSFADEIKQYLTQELSVSASKIIFVRMNELSAVDGAHSDKWREGAQEEIYFWEKSLATRHRRATLCELRVQKDAAFNSDIVALLANSDKSTINVLDVGSGPVTALGYCSDKYNIQLNLVDPLANEYKHLYAKYQFYPPVVPEACRGEDVIEHFGERQFDVAYSCNALDHSEEPLKILHNMCHLLIGGGLLYVDVHENVAVEAGYAGLHQWNFTVEKGQVVLWNDTHRHLLAVELQTYGQLSLLQYDQNINSIKFCLTKST
ncbi:MAG: methyltransferase domain-containing protein [Paraglaciecola polaris]|uniref:methyltransferase domain-containing protein n=1 Tax=Paraglaciecola polaris TaxID=222814 RepID=UPI00300183CD